MSVNRKPLTEISLDDIRELCSDGVAESAELELKSDLPSRRGSDPWHAGQSQIGDYARNAIAEEIVAFANSFGGTVVIGINETPDKPSRAGSLSPVPQVHDLARRLRQAIFDVVDPPLSILDAVGVPTEPDSTSGVVLLRVAPSRRRPHRLNSNREVYVRRVDESVRIDMRQIQELTIQSLEHGRQVENQIALRRSAFEVEFGQWLPNQVSQDSEGSAFQLIGFPTTPVELGRVAGRKEFQPLNRSVRVLFGNGRHEDTLWPFFQEHNWRPGLRSWLGEYSNNSARCLYLIRTDGSCELRFFQLHDADQKGFFSSWLMGAAALVLVWIERIRRAAAIPSVEYAFAPMLVAPNGARLAPFGAHNYSLSRGTSFPAGSVRFPVLSVGGPEEFREHLKLFDEDIWNLCGHDIQRTAPDFDFGNLKET